MLRSAAFAGQFYPLNENELGEQLENYFSRAKGERDSNAIIAPHAGYIYSGQIAAISHTALKKFSTYIILSPNHTGLGNAISIYPEGAWETPLGKIEVDDEISNSLAGELGVERDYLAHQGEHSIEVQLPFLQHQFGDEFKIVAVTIAEHNLGELEKLGDALAKIAKTKKFGVIASSDFTHFEPLESAKQKDLEAIGKIEKLDVEGFHGLVFGKGLSICGAGPITALLQYSRGIGLKKGFLLDYASSAAASGDKSSVVGYAAIKLT